MVNSLSLRITAITANLTAIIAKRGANRIRMDIKRGSEIGSLFICFK